MRDEIIMHFEFDNTKSEACDTLKQDYELNDFSTSFNPDFYDSYIQNEHQSFNCFNFENNDQKNFLLSKKDETLSQKCNSDVSEEEVVDNAEIHEEDLTKNNTIDENLKIIFNSNTLLTLEDKDETEKVDNFSKRRRFGKKHDREMHKRLLEL
mmetsp:Transcript_24803/g.22024  ORF Transcript_24803/g.22024 Transcript_24803/m.22024 type:complete len:153 (-) Transcript_24803:354-812(-)